MNILNAKFTPAQQMLARQTVYKTQSASVASLQRNLKIGFSEASALLKSLEGELVSAPRPDGWRDILPCVLDRTHLRHPKNTYWVIPEYFLAGEYPGDIDSESSLNKLRSYLNVGIDAFLDLSEFDELRPYQDDLQSMAKSLGKTIQYKRLSIPDAQIPVSKQVMRDILATITRWLVEGRKVYVHCWGGVGRTGTVVGCYLVDQGIPSQVALRHLELLWTRMTPEKQRRRPFSPETPQQIEYVQQWGASHHTEVN